TSCSKLDNGVADGVCVELQACGAYACRGTTGACVEAGSCATVDDCAAGFVCDPTGDCAPPPASTRVDDAMCDVGHEGGRPFAARALAVLGALALRRARRPL